MLQIHFQLGNSYTFSKGILQERQRWCKFEYLYSSFVFSMLDEVVYCTDRAMFLSADKQRSFGFFVNKW